MTDFVHLHNHSQYSLLDGAAKLKDMVKKAQELGMPAVAVTDHGVMHGAVDLFKICRGTGVKAIIGCEVYVAENSRFDKKSRSDERTYHLVLLAENQQGYENLCAIVSQAFIEGFYYKPRVDKELLRMYQGGIIALSACIAGEIPQALLNNDHDRAFNIAQEYIDIFGKDNFFIEIQDQGLEGQVKLNADLAKLADELDLPLVATNDVHYTNQEDNVFHDVLLCIQTGSLVEDENRLSFPTDQFYFKSQDEMAAIFAEYPDALANTVKIAERCNVEFDFDSMLIPGYDVPEGYTIESYLDDLCEQGLNHRYDNITPELRQRFNYELGIIKQMGFAGYFLIVWDIVEFCKQNEIMVGPGRGSAAGSIVSYCLGITELDPMEYDLLFERFLNPSRISMPDIDIDFCIERRGEVIDYMINKYGQDKVSMIITFGTMLAKNAVRDVGRVLNMPYSDVDKVAKLIPPDLGMTIDKALVQNPDLKAAYDSSEEVKHLIDLAKKVEGMPRHSSTHAAGVVITPNKLSKYLPVLKLGDGALTTQYAKEVVEEIGLLKMDILGLRNLTVIRDALANIKENHGVILDMNNIPLDDDKTFDMLQKGDGVGVFQLEGGGMQAVMRSLRVEKLSEIIALVALYRPGPLGSGMVDDFVDCKHGRKEIHYLHPSLAPILEETYGVILYQEQVMRIAVNMAGFSMAEADNLRKGMGKKKPEVIAKFKGKFIEGSYGNGVDKKVAEEIFNIMEKFAGYGFNKSHSAAYAVVSYQTAYLKANYALEYFAALLTSVMDKTEKLTVYIEECNRMDIKVLPPDVNESNANFTATKKGNIRFGLSAIKNVGRAPTDMIIEERKANGPYKSLLDFCERVTINSRMMDSLICAGAFDSLGMKRSQMVTIVGKCIDIAERKRKERESGQLNLFDIGLNMDEKEEDFPEVANLPEMDRKEMLTLEKAMIGLYLSGHILEEYRPYWRKYALDKYSDLAAKKDESTVYMAGIIVHYKVMSTRKGDRMARFELEDLIGKINCLVFPKAFNKVKDILAEDVIVALKGNLNLKDDEPVIFVNDVVLMEDLEKLNIPDKGLAIDGNRYYNEVDDINYYAIDGEAALSNLGVDDVYEPELSLEDTQVVTDIIDIIEDDPKIESKAKRRLYVNIMPDVDENKQRMTINKILALYPGPETCFAYFKSRGTCLSCDMSVDINDKLVDRLKKAIGDNNVFVKVINN